MQGWELIILNPDQATGANRKRSSGYHSDPKKSARLKVPWKSNRTRKRRKSPGKAAAAVKGKQVMAHIRSLPESANQNEGT